jgi:acid phosphatase family membrane protein YuiD
MDHQILITGTVACFSAQFLKTLTTLMKERKLNFKVAVGTGGMPSSHTALVVGTATAVGLVHGFNTALFDVAVVFASIVMYDATGLRRAAGRQASVLNKIMDELSSTHSIREERLKELLGHTKLEVIAGALYGVIVAMLLHYGW